MGKEQKIAFVISECVPFVKTGGLADVAGALPPALRTNGTDIRVFLPLYRDISCRRYDLRFCAEFDTMNVQMAEKSYPFYCWEGRQPGTEVTLYFIESAAFFNRQTIYTNDPDEGQRFVLFQKAVLELLKRMDWQPDVIHCNDWQTALIPAMLADAYSSDPFFSKTATVFSIHNIEYQGRFDKKLIEQAGLDTKKFFPGGPYEFEKQFNCMKAGIESADVLNTVSETYAGEIQSRAYGAGMDGILARRKKDLFGILNGIDTKTWNPRSDKLIEQTYSYRTIERKAVNKQQLLHDARLKYDERIPLIGMVTRLAGQKGVELLQPVIGQLMELPLQIIALGSGEPALEEFMRQTMKTYPQKFWCYIGYNERLAHLITAAGDMFLMPSRYEPCGLNQMYSLNYGTIPIVRKTGGLADTVKDYHEYYGSGNGFSFTDFTAPALLQTVRRALDIFTNKNEWRQMMKRGMAEDFSWEKAATQYAALYNKALQKSGKRHE